MMSASEETPNSFWDESFKLLLEKFLPEFLELAYPELFAEIDWTVPPQWLNPETHYFRRPSQVEKKVVDKLVRVKLKNGKFQILHPEIQASREKDFDGRVRSYNIRLELHHQEPIATLLILTDGERNWRVDRYAHEIGSLKINTTHFLLCKVLDWKEEDLQAHRNVCTLFMRAARIVWATRDQADQRLKAKVALNQEILDDPRLLDRYDAALNIVEGLLTLDPKRDEICYRETERYAQSKESTMQLNVLSRRYFDDGRKKERQETAKLMLKENLGVDLIARVTGLSPDAVRELTQTQH